MTGQTPSAQLTVPGVATSSRSNDPGGTNTLWMAPFLIWLPLLPYPTGTILLGFFVALRVLQGHDFHYPWLGKRVEEFLGKA